jgi:hypothetical protein
MQCVFASLLVVLASAQPIVVGPQGGAWDAPATWLGGVAPKANDDVVYQCSSNNPVVVATTVSVRSVTVSGKSCVAPSSTSLVISGGGVLTARSFSATDGAKVYLNNGTLSAPAVFDSGAMLGGSGRMSGEVVLQGNALLMAGESCGNDKSDD